MAIKREHNIALVAALLLFVATHVYGQSAELFVSRARRCTPRGCVSESTGRGMSVCLGRTGPREWLYATAAHNFDMKPDRVYVGISGKWVAAELIARNKGDDIALLTIRHSGDLKCASLAEGGASGDSVFFHRRGGRRARGTVTSSTRLVNVQPVQGDSGSAVYDKDGDVAGIVRGYSEPGTTLFAPAHKIRRLILSTMGKLPVCGDPPPPPKEEVAPDSRDHSEILDRLSNLDSQIEDLGNRIEWLKRQPIVVDWIDLDGNILLTRTFSSNRIQLYANTIDVYNSEKRVDRDTYRPDEPMVIRIIKKKQQ